MSDAKFVYKEVSGKDLEKATSDGWEFVNPSTALGPFGPLSCYIVRRPFEMPEAMKLTEELEVARRSAAARETLAAHLGTKIGRARDILKRYVDAAQERGRDKPTRDQLVDMFRRLERDVAAELG